MEMHAESMGEMGCMVCSCGHGPVVQKGLSPPWVSVFAASNQIDQFTAQNIVLY